MTRPHAQRDRVEALCGARIQHGLLSRRVYLMKLGKADPAELIPAMHALAKRHGYTKITAKIPSGQTRDFVDAGYHEEARVPDFYGGEEDASFIAHFLDERRMRSANEDDLNSVLTLAKARYGEGVDRGDLLPKARIRQCTPDDIDCMSRIYRTVFPSYPFPIDQPDYLLTAMRGDVVYFGVEIDGEMVSLASSEMDPSSQSVEMTDFATLPERRGLGLAGHLLATMEPAMRDEGLRTAYTIARAISPGMNITFAKLGYAFGGRLISNTHISGQIESMNIWYKTL